MNNRKINLKKITATTATVMLCTAALNVMVIRAHASDDTSHDNNPQTTATYTSKDSATAASQLNTPQTNGNVGWNGNNETTGTTTSSVSTNTDSQSSTDAENGSSSSINPSSDQRSTSSDIPNATTPSNIAVSFVSGNHIVGTAYLGVDHNTVNTLPSLPTGYHLSNINDVYLKADSTHGVANISVVGNDADHASGDNQSQDQGNDMSNTSHHDTSDVSNNNSNNTSSTSVNNTPSNNNDDNLKGLVFPQAPANPNHHKIKRHHSVKPKVQYHHPVKMPQRVLTPETPKGVVHHRIHRTKVENPMLRPGNNPDRIRRPQDFRSQVHFNHRTRHPQRINKVKSYESFDKSVLRYQPMLHKVTKYYHMTRYDDLFLAIMEVESKGNGDDVMRSSESAGLNPGSLHPRQSIEQAVRYMRSIVIKAQAMDRIEHQDKRLNPDAYHDYAQDDRILAQTYDYGGGFLDYIAHSKYGYSEAMSQEYSKDVVAKQLGNANGTTYYYNNPTSQLYHRDFLYQNGGNYLYGDQVAQYLVSGYMKGILNNLMQYRNRPYVFGGKTPRTNFDCSGLVSYGFKSIGLSGFPDFTETQWNATKSVQDLNHAKPGDLIFFKGTYGKKDFISHVGFLIDKHTMLDSNDNGVEFTNIDQPYWREHFAGIHRVPHTYQLNRMAKKAAQNAGSGIYRSAQ